MTSRMKHAGFTAVAALGLFAGAAGIAGATTGNNSPDPAPATVQVDDFDVDGGVNCEDGIDTATGAECDGGPAAAQAEEANEAPDNESDAEAESEANSDEDVDGVDHEFEGEEVGNNGDGVPDADDATEADEQAD